MYKFIIRPFFFLFDAENVHNVVLKFFSRATFLYPLLRTVYLPSKNETVKFDSLIFKNRLGLAAGFDKNGIAIRFFEALGFSHMEVGTVTPLPQPGNDKPRIFRLKKDKALINRLGFNNSGADAINENILKARKHLHGDFIIGVNIGKNKNTGIKDAYQDYKICFEKLYDAADYFTINISSPNTEGLRLLHEQEYLDKLLSEIQNLNKKISKSKNCSLKCIFLKIAPELSDDMLKMIVLLCIKNELTGLIATNTTVERKGIKTQTTELGGLSGKPLMITSNKILSRLNALDKNSKLKLTGVGGVFDKYDFEKKLSAGASLVQVYTGFIYEGPAIIKKILN